MAPCVRTKFVTFIGLWIAMLFVGLCSYEIARGDTDDDAYLKEKRKTLEKNIEEGKKERAAEKEENRKRLEKRMEEARAAREAEKKAAAEARRQRDEERRAEEADEEADEESETEESSDDEPTSGGSGTDESGSSSEGDSSDSADSASGSSSGSSASDSETSESGGDASSDDQPAGAGSGFYIGDTPSDGNQRSGKKNPSSTEQPPGKLPAGAGVYIGGGGNQGGEDQPATQNSEEEAGSNTSSLSGSEEPPLTSTPQSISQSLPDISSVASSPVSQAVALSSPRGANTPARAANPGGGDRRPADAAGVIVPDLEAHPIRFADGYPATTFGEYIEDGQVLLIDKCSWTVELTVGYTLFLGADASEAQMANYPISGSLRQNDTLLATINEIPYFHPGRRTVPARRGRQIPEPHGFGLVNVGVELTFGEYAFTMIVDEPDRIQETDESNNVTTTRISVRADPEADLPCAPTSIAAETVTSGSRAAGGAANLPVAPAGRIPDQNTQRSVLSQANLVVELDTPMSPTITIRNSGRTATDAPAFLQISCSGSSGEECPSDSFAAELARGGEVPALQPGESYTHLVDAWPRDILWPRGTFSFEARVNGNNVVAESPSNNIATSSMTWNHSTDSVASHCLGCHTSDGRGTGPPPSELVERASEVGIDALVQTAINGYRGMPPKGQVEWLSEAELRDVLLRLLEM